MSRRARITVAGVPHYVVQRGHNRQATFFAEEDCLAYRHNLKEGEQRYNCAIHAYVLMTNHVHLLVTPSNEDGLPRLMRYLGRRRQLRLSSARHVVGRTIQIGPGGSGTVSADLLLVYRAQSGAGQHGGVAAGLSLVELCEPCAGQA